MIWADWVIPDFEGLLATFAAAAVLNERSYTQNV